MPTSRNMFREKEERFRFGGLPVLDEFYIAVLETALLDIPYERREQALEMATQRITRAWNYVERSFLEPITRT